ncbi:MAG: phage protease [Rhodocyclaceae bacterium]|nr:phage protease [Rhodocyclaceae bacterium]
MSRKTTSTLSVSALAVELGAGAAPSEIRLIPAGPFRSWDGRPEGIPGWNLSESNAKKIIAWAAARASDLVIDYEHQTLNAKENGKPAPAAGWFKSMEWRPNDGLYATDVRWTAAAAAMIESGEYKYISPVIGWDKKTGTVLSLPMAGLVNNPAIDGLADLSGLAATFLPEIEQENQMIPKELLARLGLPETATEAEVLAALSALEATHGTEISALKAAPPDPAQYVAVATMSALQADLSTAQTELAALKAEQAKGKVDAVIQEALNAGRLTPAQEAWARELGTVKLESLSAYLETVQPGTKPGTTQTGGKAPVETAALSSTYTPPPGFSADTRGMEIHTSALAYQASHAGVTYEAAVAAIATASKP